MASINNDLYKLSRILASFLLMHCGYKLEFTFLYYTTHFFTPNVSMPAQNKLQICRFSGLSQGWDFLVQTQPLALFTN